MKTLLKVALVIAACGTSSVYAAESSECHKHVSNTYITFIDTIDKKEKLGAKYANYINKINDLEKTGFFKKFKITQQHVQLRSSYTAYSTPKNSQEVTISFTLEFDPNHQAYTELAKLNSTNLDIQINELKTGKCD